MPDSAIDVESVVRDVRRAGYARLPGALPAEQTERLRDVLHRLSLADDEAHGPDELVRMRERGALRNLAASDAAFHPLLETSPALDAVDALLGPRGILNCYDALTLFPGEGRYPWDYHTDVMDVAGVSFPADRVPGVTVLYYVDRVREENGATWVVPGSHLTLAAEPDPEVMAPLSVPLEVEPGDAVVLDPRIWHCAGTNGTGEARTLVKMLFTAAWYRPQMDFTRAVPAEVLARLGPRARRYMNVPTVPPTSVAELRRRLFLGDAVHAAEETPTTTGV